MQNHVRIYLEFFGYGEQDFKPCEICGHYAVDVHHILKRGMGGSKEKDFIENLAGLCRDHHNKADDGIIEIPKMIQIHKAFVLRERPDYNFDADKLLNLSG